MITNISISFPKKTHKEVITIAFNSIKSFLITMFELLWIPNLSKEQLSNLIKIDDPEYFNKLKSDKKGMVFLTGHFGNWEFTGHCININLDEYILAITKPMRNKLIDKYINKIRSKYGLKPVAMDTGIKEIMRTILNGGSFILLADQSAPKESMYVNFFNRPAATFQGPAVFTLKSKAKLVFAVAIRQKDYTYNMLIEEVNTNDLLEYNQENILELTKRHVAILEKYISLYPEQWLWSHKRWKHTDDYLKEHGNIEKII